MGNILKSTLGTSGMVFLRYFTTLHINIIPVTQLLRGAEATLESSHGAPRAGTGGAPLQPRRRTCLGVPPRPAVGLDGGGGPYLTVSYETALHERAGGRGGSPLPYGGRRAQGPSGARHPAGYRPISAYLGASLSGICEQTPARLITVNHG